VFLATAAAVAGCTAFDVFKPAPESKPAAAAAKPRKAPPAPVVAWTPPAAPSRVVFDHKFHAGRGPTCADCHESVEANGKMAMPKVEFCMDCHVDIDDKKPKERTVAAFLDKDGKTPKWSNVTAQGPDVVFSHKPHLDKKLACGDCHKAMEENVKVGPDLFQDMDSCTKCHEAKGAKNECATCHKSAAASLAAGKGPFGAPANHDAAWKGVHGLVAGLPTPRTRGERCDDCHGKPKFPESGRCDVCHAGTKPANHDAAWLGAHGPSIRDELETASKSCGICHDGAAFPQKARCDVCHVGTRPADHERSWREVHGQVVRREPESVTGRCAFCHDKSGFPTESRCTGCHMTEPPRDHTQSWRVNAGHGLAAAMDRTRCTVCHTADTCAACHAVVAPRSHRGAWGAPRNKHCANCHLPLKPDAPDGCGVCHKGTPSHSTASPMPSNPPHRPDMVCRKCHVPPKTLPHADNGTNCVICHR
jgi:c(7)-type cytochrome triheme protein